MVTQVANDGHEALHSFSSFESEGNGLAGTVIGGSGLFYSNDPNLRAITPPNSRALRNGRGRGGADGGLLRADVVRPDGGAGVLGSLGDKAAAGKEIDEGWKGGVQEFF